MKYDFTSIINRHGQDALAVENPPHGPKEGFDLIPMWVADMNFPTVPSVPKAIMERAAHPLYGYFRPSKAYYDAIITWQKERNGVENLEEKHIGYENGVLGGAASAMASLCARGGKVLLHSPTYIGFTHMLDNNGYHAVHSPLKKDENGVYRMDYEDMERRIVDENIHAAIMCSPHNPTGRVWEKWELEKAYELFKKYDVNVISDEIWSDLIMPGHKHIPSQSVSEDAKNRTIALYAPSKTFNLAGLIGSYHVIYNDKLRHRVEDESAMCMYNSMNVMSEHALIGAYSDEGQEWLGELIEVLSGNLEYMCDFLTKHAPGIIAKKPEGTYMLFIDCEEWCKKHGCDVEALLKAGTDVGVEWQDGRAFYGPYHIRVNVALPLSRVEEACRRLEKYVFTDN